MSLEANISLSQNVSIDNFQIEQNYQPIFGTKIYELCAPGNDARVRINTMSGKISISKKDKNFDIDLGLSSTTEGRMFPDITDFHFYQNNLFFVHQYSSHVAFDDFDDFNIEKVNLQTLKHDWKTYDMDFDQEGRYLGKEFGMFYEKGFLSCLQDNRLIIGFNETGLDRKNNFKYITFINLDSMSQYKKRITNEDLPIKTLKAMFRGDSKGYIIALEQDYKYSLFEIKEFSINKIKNIDIPPEIFDVVDKELEGEDRAKALLEKVNQRFLIDNNTLYGFFSLEPFLDTKQIYLLRNNLSTNQTILKKSPTSLSMHQNIKMSIDDFFDTKTVLKLLE